MLYLYYCDSGRKHMFCENVTHGPKVWHAEFLRHQPLGTNDSLLIGNVKKFPKLTYTLSVLQCWTATDIKTGWWQGKSQDFFVTSTARRQKPTREENQHCCYCCYYNTWRFVMFSVITNIYNKKTKGPTLMELFAATWKQKKFSWQLEMFDVCTTGDTAHINTIFVLATHARQHGCIDIHCCKNPCL